MKQKKYWYLTTHRECPVCGHYERQRERKYTRKPKDDRKRHKYETAYDWCDVEVYG